jgi:hypothetical protein
VETEAITCSSLKLVRECASAGLVGGITAQIPLDAVVREVQVMVALKGIEVVLEGFESCA